METKAKNNHPYLLHWHAWYSSLTITAWSTCTRDILARDPTSPMFISAAAESSPTLAPLVLPVLCLGSLPVFCIDVALYATGTAGNLWKPGVQPWAFTAWYLLLPFFFFFSLSPFFTFLLFSALDPLLAYYFLFPSSVSNLGSLLCWPVHQASMWKAQFNCRLFLRCKHKHTVSVRTLGAVLGPWMGGSFQGALFHGVLLKNSTVWIWWHYRLLLLCSE